MNKIIELHLCFCRREFMTNLAMKFLMQLLNQLVQFTAVLFLFLEADKHLEWQIFIIQYHKWYYLMKAGKHKERYSVLWHFSIEYRRRTSEKTKRNKSFTKIFEKGQLLSE